MSGYELLKSDDDLVTPEADACDWPNSRRVDQRVTELCLGRSASVVGVTRAPAGGDRMIIHQRDDAIVRDQTARATFKPKKCLTFI